MILIRAILALAVGDFAAQAAIAPLLCTTGANQDHEDSTDAMSDLGSDVESHSGLSSTESSELQAELAAPQTNSSSAQEYEPVDQGRGQQESGKKFCNKTRGCCGACCSVLLGGPLLYLTAMKGWGANFQNVPDCGMSEYVSRFQQDFAPEQCDGQKVWRMEPWEYLPWKGIDQNSMYSAVDESKSEALANGYSEHSLVFERHPPCNWQKEGFLAVRSAFGEGGHLGAQNWCSGMQGFQNVSCLLTGDGTCSAPGDATIGEESFAKYIRQPTGGYIETRWFIDGCDGASVDSRDPQAAKHFCEIMLNTKNFKGCNNDLNCIAVMGYTTGQRYLEMRDATR